MAEHTPGPWRVGEDDEKIGYLWSLHIYSDDQDGPIDIAWCSCSQDPSQDGRDSPRLSAARANASLVADAPDLLEKLSCALDEFETSEGRIADPNSPHWSVAARHLLDKHGGGK